MTRAPPRHLPPSSTLAPRARRVVTREIDLDVARVVASRHAHLLGRDALLERARLRVLAAPAEERRRLHVVVAHLREEAAAAAARGSSFSPSRRGAGGRARRRRERSSVFRSPSERWAPRSRDRSTPRRAE